MQKLLAAVILCFTISFFNVAKAQTTFDKKSGEFSSGSAVIAKLADEKVKQAGGKNYTITDASGQNTLLSYTINRWQDTLGGPFRYWYFVACKPLGLTAYRSSFNSLNTFKEIGAVVTDKNLLQADGKINEAAMKTYFASLQNEYPDYPNRYKAVNDSLIKLFSSNPPPIERNMREDVFANDYGKIGQGNTVIGYWEYIEAKDDAALENTTHLFLIKDLNGGIICVSWIEISGAHTYVFKGGQRSAQNWTVPDFVHNNPIQNKQSYIINVSHDLIKAGLL